MITKQPQGMPEGIYFGMDDETYHGDPALSHSGMTKLLISWPDFWVNSSLNPQRKKFEATAAMEFGKQSGMLLTQPKVFHQTYNTHGRSNPTSKGNWLSSVQWQKLTESIDAIIDVKIAAAHFQDGYAEVAVFWHDPDTGIMLRVKFDFLRTFGIIDVKRIKAMDDWTIGNAVRDQGLDIQNYLYLEGMKAARRMLLEMGKDGRVQLASAQKVDPHWLEEFAHDTDVMFRFLFQRSTPPYIWDFVELEEDALIEGTNSVHAAIQRYKAGLQMFGIGKPPLGRERLRKIGSFFIPRRRYQYED